MVGRYRLIRRLRSGASSELYLADDSETGSVVAVKVARRMDANRLEAFRRQAEAARAVDHPGVVAIIEVGEDPAAGPYLAMEYVSGTNLLDWARGEDVDLADRFEVLFEVLAVVERAHERGIVHGSLRPERILVDEDRSVKITGFGRPAEADAGQRTRAYRAPETSDGDRPPSPRTDDYALAVIAFEVLAGPLPRHETEAGGEEPPALAIAESALAPALRATFARALATEPAERYSSARVFFRTLVAAGSMDDAVRRRLLEALADTPRRRLLRKRARIGGLLLAGGAVAAIVAIAGERLVESVLDPTPLRLVDVTSSPPGALVLVDGRSVGSTPRRAYVEATARRLRLEKEGFRSVDIDLTESEESGIRVAMEPSRTARALAEARRVAEETAAPVQAESPPPETSPERGGLIPWLADLFR